MVILLFFAFVSGLITIFAPCIWPLLPIILSATVTGGHRKPLGITLGIITSFAIFTLTISYIVKIIPFDPDILRLFAVIVIGFLGLTLIIPRLSQFLEGYVSRLSGRFGNGGNRSGFTGGFVTGISLGAVWTPCAGPILATIATLAATRAVNTEIILVTVAYVIGIGIPLFIFATFGQILLTKTRFASQYTGRVQQVFGIIMLLTALAIFTNYDKTLQAKLLDAVPSYSQFLNTFEGSDAVKNQLDAIKNQQSDLSLAGQVGELGKNMLDKASLLPKGQAPEFIGITNWLNSEPLTMKKLRGKVVLIDFWTYTCINCIRTLPHVIAWDKQYRDKGLVVVGVHSPEFAFEKKTANVARALTERDIAYPVAQDNDFATWQAYQNQYWPAKYLIDKDGAVRYTHFGEGEYENTEKAIQTLLKETGTSVPSDTIEISDKTPKARNTPELYLGSRRMEYLYPGGGVSNATIPFKLPADTVADWFSFGGTWTFTDEYAISEKDSVLVLNFTAKDVYLVMMADTPNLKVRVQLDGKAVSGSIAGKDVEDGIVTVSKDDIHHLIHLLEQGNHVLRLEFLSPGVKLHAFTFG